MLKKSPRGNYIIDYTDLDIKKRSGNEIRSTCPYCRETREHPDDPSLAIDVTTGLGMCHHCKTVFILKDFTKDLQKKYPPRVIRKQDEDRDFMKDIFPINQLCESFLAKRNIDPEVAKKAHVGTSVINGITYLAFPFIENGRAVNVQYKRADGEKKEFLFSQGGKMIPWNIDCINTDNAGGPMYITEGMMDAIAMMQSGFQNVVSVPNGAGSRLEVFDNYKKLISKNFTHIVFAGDTDEAGIKLQNNIKEYFKGTDVGTVIWKWRNYDAKDANEMLQSGGTEAVAHCVRNAHYDDEKDYSVSRCNSTALWNLFRNGSPEAKGIGISEVDKIIRFLPGYMYVLTGYPGSGKSSYINFITMSLLHLYGWRTLYYSPEKMPEENHIKELVSIVTGKEFNKKTISEELMLKADEFLSGNIVHVSEDISLLDILLKKASTIIRRHGIKVFVIDPFLYLQINNLNGKAETTRVSEMLIQIRQFAKDNNVVVIVVAHPRKPNLIAERPDLMQMMYEVAGSSGFANTCDVGIAIERPDVTKDTMRIMCCKARYDYLATLGETRLTYIPKCGRYIAEKADATTRAHVLDNWTDDITYYGRKDVSCYQSNEPF